MLQIKNPLLLGSLFLVMAGAPALAQDDDGILFDSGTIFHPIDENDLDDTTKNQIEDPKNTDSYIFKAETDDELNEKFTLNFYVKDFASSSSPYYRAHPVFMRCLQKIYSHVWGKTQKRIRIKQGFQTAGDVGGGTKIQDDYARSGMGVILEYADGLSNVEDLERIANGAIFYCLPLFSQQLQDLGIIIMSDSVHIHMTGGDDNTPYFASDGYPNMNTAAFAAWCYDRLDEATDPKKTPQCQGISELSSGEKWPSTMSLEEAVGGQDRPITRDMTEDFKRLMQFPGRNIDFANTERDSNWCGLPGNPCVDCRDNFVGSAVDTRCGSRIMSYRLYSGIRMLQKMVREQIPTDKLKVLEAYDEPHSEATDGDTPTDSLHKEGRAARLQLSVDNSAPNLGTLSKLAICAGLDFVQYNGDNTVLVASKRQKHQLPRMTTFTEATLLHTAIPSEEHDNYQLPFGHEWDEYPLYDGTDQENKPLGQHSTVGMFKSENEDNPYYRLDVAISRCFDGIMNYEAKWNKGVKIDVQVRRAFLNHKEMNDLFLPSLDKRGYATTLGRSIQLIYHPDLHGGDFISFNSTKYSIHRLAAAAIAECAPIFFQANAAMGLGFYNDGLYIDMREEFDAWFDGSPQALPPLTLPSAYKEILEQHYVWAIQNRLFNPQDPEEALNREVPPQPQSPEYEHKAPPNAGSENQDCVPQENTEFCVESKPFRDHEVDLIWKEMKRLHMIRDHDQIEHALKNCFGACSTCVTGQFYAKKTEHCDNLLHWSPFRLLNTEHNVTNLYQRDNLEIMNYACGDGRHCVDKAPLFASLGENLDKLYRPDPKRSLEKELYGVNDNPLPVYELILKLYMIEAKGTLGVWVQTHEELRDLREFLKVAMCYNKDITHVYINVVEDDKLLAVDQALEAMIADWVKELHPDNTRVAIPDFTIRGLPQGLSKRSVRGDLHSDLLYRRKTWESQWWLKSLW